MGQLNHDSKQPCMCEGDQQAEQQAERWARNNMMGAEQYHHLLAMGWRPWGRWPARRLQVVSLPRCSPRSRLHEAGRTWVAVGGLGLDTPPSLSKHHGHTWLWAWGWSPRVQGWLRRDGVVSRRDFTARDLGRWEKHSTHACLTLDLFCPPTWQALWF